MEFRILGPLEVLSDGRPLDLGGQKQRALLALLVVEANRVVSTDRLIEALWEEEAPETAQKALQVYVSQLRQALDPERKEAARMDGAGPFSMFFFIIIPHLARAISVVVMIETLFLLAVFAEIFVTTAGGPGLASTNLAFLIYRYALLEYDVGAASAGGVLAIVLANVVAAFLVRAIAKNIEA